MAYTPSSTRKQRGIALMLVLWIIVLLTIIAIALTTSQRTESTLAANQLASSKFRALSDAAINYAALHLMTSPPLENDEDTEALWLPDAQPRILRFAGIELEITIVNEASLIDLNVADRALLAGLLNAVGIDAEEADPLLDAILDWRDEDDLHLLNGAEDPDYEEAGLPHGAKDGPFDSVEELRQVLGFDQALFHALAPALTVSSGQSRVIAEHAPALVQAALEGITLEEMEQRLEEEANADIVGDELLPLNRGGPLYRIRVTGKTADGARRNMEALVKIQRNARPPVTFMWRRYALAAQAAHRENQGDVDSE